MFLKNYIHLRSFHYNLNCFFKHAKHFSLLCIQKSLEKTTNLSAIGSNHSFNFQIDPWRLFTQSICLAVSTLKFSSGGKENFKTFQAPMPEFIKFSLSKIQSKAEKAKVIRSTWTNIGNFLRPSTFYEGEKIRNSINKRPQKLFPAVFGKFILLFFFGHKHTQPG